MPKRCPKMIASRGLSLVPVAPQGSCSYPSLHSKELWNFGQLVPGTLVSHWYQTKTPGSHHLGASFGHKISSNYACLRWFKDFFLVILRVLLNTLQTPFKAPFELLWSSFGVPFNIFQTFLNVLLLPNNN